MKLLPKPQKPPPGSPGGWRKGKTGNPKGLNGRDNRGERKTLSSRLLALVDDKTERAWTIGGVTYPKGSKTTGEIIMIRLAHCAAEGEPWAQQIALERTEGKVKQPLDLPKGTITIDIVE